MPFYLNLPHPYLNFPKYVTIRWQWPCVYCHPTGGSNLSLFMNQQKFMNGLHISSGISITYFLVQQTAAIWMMDHVLVQKVQFPLPAQKSVIRWCSRTSSLKKFNPFKWLLRSLFFKARKKKTLSSEFQVLKSDVFLFLHCVGTIKLSDIWRSKQAKHEA